MTSVPLPDGLTCALLKEAKGAEVAFWIGQANTAAGKRVVTKNGHIDEQRKRLTNYYGLDLLAEDPVVAAVVPKTHEDHIKQRQFSWLQELGEEWSSAAACGKEFFLSDGSSGTSSSAFLNSRLMCFMSPTSMFLPFLVLISQQLQVLVPTTSMAQSVHPVTIFAQPGSMPLVLRGDGSALPPFVAPNHTATVQMSPGSSVPLFTEAPVVLPRTVNDVAVLNSCQLDMESIQRAQDLRDAIQQVEDGTVSRVREHYGPRDGRATDEMWGHLKGKITKRERLYGLLAGAFKGDKHCFFEFFTVSAASGSKKRRGASEPTLVALRMVVEAIPRCQKDLRDERRNTRYVDPASGEFSDELWRAVWGDRNDWYVW
ncbi:hypothetical protein DEU56DRAFT_748984 [Suillus clintonianus]|uniref:uncharacterized protein n=1 Tax=Suillus clintonianus TaxID=1904413 RepID=UPI001B879780|nr:uncharacterized protein DEU56DRAFT_748984 [Suillus clintonianus]KAG2114385.1 hypothetical protein DEU56DRAFT_748984 [Suillus clintonianus]